MPRAAYVKSSSYVDEVVHEDIHRVDGIERNPDRVRNLLKSLARNISTLTTAEIIRGHSMTGSKKACPVTVARTHVALTQ